MRKILLLIPAILLFWCLTGCEGNLTPEERIVKLKNLVEEEKFEKALKELWIVVDQRPTDSTVLFYGSAIFFGLNRFDSSTSYAKKLTALYPEHLEGYRLLYRAAGMIEDYDTQLRAVSQLGYIEKNRPKYYYDLANLNFKQGEYGMAKSICAEMLKSDPDNKTVLFLLANSLASAGEIDSAIVILEKLDRLYPGSVEVLSNMASFYATKRDYPQAEYHFQIITDLYPDYLPGWFGLGNVRLRLADTLGAKAAYRQVYTRDTSFLQVDSVLRSLDPLPLR